MVNDFDWALMVSALHVTFLVGWDRGNNDTFVLLDRNFGIDYCVTTNPGSALGFGRIV